MEDIRKNKSKTKIFKFKESIGTANDDEERIDIISVKVGLDKSGSKKVHKCHRAWKPVRVDEIWARVEAHKEREKECKEKKMDYDWKTKKCKGKRKSIDLWKFGMLL